MLCFLSKLRVMRTMDFLLATAVDDYAHLKAIGQHMDTYRTDARWLVIGEDTPDKRAFLKAYTLKRNQPTYFIPLNAVQKLSRFAFSGKGGALNAALLCSAVTKTPVMILDGVTLVSKEFGRVSAMEANAVAGCCAGCPQDVEYWTREIDRTLSAFEARVVTSEFTKTKLQEILSGTRTSEEAKTCDDALFIQPEAAAKVCFSPQSTKPFSLWQNVAKRMGQIVAFPNKPWVAHAREEGNAAYFEKNRVSRLKESLGSCVVENILKKTTFRTYSDYLLDEACAITLEENKEVPALSQITVGRIKALKNVRLNEAIAKLNQAPPKSNLSELREEIRAFFLAWRSWPKIIEKCREKEVIRFEA